MSLSSFLFAHETKVRLKTRTQKSLKKTLVAVYMHLNKPVRRWRTRERVRVLLFVL